MEIAKVECVNCVKWRCAIKAHLPLRFHNWYKALPCFVNVIEEAFAKKFGEFSLEELASLHAIWYDGLMLGHYEEATKDAEGS